MLGWHIAIYRVLDEPEVRRCLLDAGERQDWGGQVSREALGERLAVWQAEVYGLDWIERACEAGGGLAVSGGYPSWYLLRASDVLATIRNRQSGTGLPDEHSTWVSGRDDVLTPERLGGTTIDDDALSRCRPDTWVLVEAWDES